MSSKAYSPIAVLPQMVDVEETRHPFGKRYGQQLIRLKPEHLAALASGQLLALDVQEEYVIFLGMNASATPPIYQGNQDV